MRRDLVAGDRVLFSGDHPWSGHVGVVVEPMDTPVGAGWRVEIEGQAGLCAFADEQTVEMIGKTEGRSQTP